MEDRIRDDRSKLACLRRVQEKIATSESFSDAERRSVDHSIEKLEQSIDAMVVRAHEINTVWAAQIADIEKSLREREAVLNTLPPQSDVFEIFKEEHIRLQTQLARIRADVQK